jgi:hypothetical protein
MSTKDGVGDGEKGVVAGQGLKRSRERICGRVREVKQLLGRLHVIGRQQARLLLLDSAFGHPALFKERRRASTSFSSSPSPLTHDIGMGSIARSALYRRRISPARLRRSTDFLPEPDFSFHTCSISTSRDVCTSFR